jgi:hypothetical protein
MPHSRGFERRADERSTDPVPLGRVVDALMGEEVFSRGMPVAQLTAAWASIVGPGLAKASAPVALDEGVLTLRVTDGPWGAQVEFLREEIRRKADEALGGQKVRAIRVIVRPNTR